MTPGRLLLVRHGESTWNAEDRWQGQADPPLSTRGEEQARAAAVTLAALPPFAAVFTSPLQRARRTAELLADGAGLPRPQPVPGLEEQDAGAWTGLTHAEIDARHPGARARGRRPPDYEPAALLEARVRAALLALPPDGPHLVVVHEGVLRAVDPDPAALPNLGARWLDPALEPIGPRWSLRSPARHLLRQT